MKTVYPEYYEEFKCIAGDCPDSCCQGWEVDADKDSLKYYKTLNPDLEIKQRIDRVLDKDEFGNTIFTLVSKKRCPFLNSDNLCDMHIAIGQEHTPFTCRNFPRFTHSFGAVKEIGISFSCPVAADLIYNINSHLKFKEITDSNPPELNDIDALTFYKLKNYRSKAIGIMQNDDLHIYERLNSLLDLAVKVQNEIQPYEDGTQNIVDFLGVFNNPEIINKEWVEKINKHRSFDTCIDDNYFNENTAVYFIYKYLMDALEDYDVLSKIKMAVVGVLINTYFGGDSWTIHLWSKETEHSQYNMDRYKKLLKEEKCLSVTELKKMLK